MDTRAQAIDFGEYRLMPAERLLVGKTGPVPIGRRALEILTALIERRSEIVTRDELMHEVWGGQVVEENTLAVHVSALRRALGEGRGGVRYIATVPGLGYRFLAAVKPEPGPAALEPTGRGNLQRSDTPLLGRDTALADVSATLRASSLVTLTGPGGIGKTRLARAVGGAVAAEYADGVWWIELAALTEPDQVPGIVAGTLGFRCDKENPLAQLVTRLRSKVQLLILDNCEHVASGVVEVVTALQQLESVRLLATSLEPLGVAGERIRRLEPLALPDPGKVTAAEAGSTPAVALFVVRAKSVAQDFALAESNVAAVAEICRRLDGVPLALELAAARAALLGPAAVAKRLDERFLELSSGRRDASPRHQTLRALLEWSCGLLGPDELRVLDRIAVFAGSCTLEAVEAVAGDDTLPAWRVSDLLASLIAKSLVIAERTPHGTRYRMLQTTRTYAAERLVRSGHFGDAMRRCADYLCRLFEQADEMLEKVTEYRWTAQWWPELDNLRAALDWCFGAGAEPALGVALTAQAEALWAMAGTEGQTRLATAFTRLDDDTPPGIASAVWLGRWHAAHAAGGGPEQIQAAEQALVLARRSAQPVRIVRAALASVWSTHARQSWTEGDALLAEVRRLSAAHGFTTTLIRVEVEIGQLRILENRQEEGLAALDRARALNQVVQDEWQAVAICCHSGTAYANLGDFERALASFRESMQILRASRNLDRAQTIREYLVCLLMLTDRAEEALHLMPVDGLAAQDILQSIGNSLCILALLLAIRKDGAAARVHRYILETWPTLACRRTMAGLIFRRLGEMLRDRSGAAEDMEDGCPLHQPRELAALALSELRSGPGTSSAGAVHFELMRSLRPLGSSPALT